MLVRISFGVRVVRIRQQHICIRKLFIILFFLSVFVIFRLQRYGGFRDVTIPSAGDFASQTFGITVFYRIFFCRSGF